MIYSILLVTEVILSIALIVLILLQHGKGADAGAAFGSGASGTVFGSRGAGNFLSRTTGILAALFFANCLALAAVISAQQVKSDSVVDSVISDVPNQPTVVESAPADVPGDIPEQTVTAPASSTPADVPQ
ncbi:MAG: preprotein translocase subunit SecG [bacterium]